LRNWTTGRCNALRLPYNMFNKQRRPMDAKLKQHLSVPENRLRYAFDFLLNHGPDFVDYSKCYNAIAEWSDKLDTSEAHY